MSADNLKCESAHLRSGCCHHHRLFKPPVSLVLCWQGRTTRRKVFRPRNHRAACLSKANFQRAGITMPPPTPNGELSHFIKTANLAIHDLPFENAYCRPTLLAPPGVREPLACKDDRHAEQ